jgi:hypothetical protein
MVKIAFIGILFVSIFMSSLFCPVQTLAASEDDIDRLTTYAAIIGRAVACGVNTENALRRVDAWIDKRFPPGSSDQKKYLPIYINAVQYHADQQASGKSPDTCSQVKKNFRKMQWP